MSIPLSPIWLDSLRVEVNGPSFIFSLSKTSPGLANGDFLVNVYWMNFAKFSLSQPRMGKAIPTGLGHQGCFQTHRMGKDAERLPHLSLPPGKLSKARQERWSSFCMLRKERESKVNPYHSSSENPSYDPSSSPCVGHYCYSSTLAAGFYYYGINWDCCACPQRRFKATVLKIESTVR